MTPQNNISAEPWTKSDAARRGPCMFTARPRCRDSATATLIIPITARSFGRPADFGSTSRPRERGSGMNRIEAFKPDSGKTRRWQEQANCQDSDKAGDPGSADLGQELGRPVLSLQTQASTGGPSAKRGDHMTGGSTCT
ncbi:uncharacterized protein N7477_008085 [Penicillium maclennaniae]|uniref:uncharacterized protein n=1 Tax=Penicillium maclennaniae TaxID=1343394 RepID=UPI0025406199|nr:uncharacterized protein N7477_008085 [Penicillium maclennaniae]KAJ5665637.1 hypothetical protein N7477_008085 [Penicillium maclennaniae]